MLYLCSSRCIMSPRLFSNSVYLSSFAHVFALLRCFIYFRKLVRESHKSRDRLTWPRRQRGRDGVGWRLSPFVQWHPRCDYDHGDALAVLVWFGALPRSAVLVAVGKCSAAVFCISFLVVYLSFAIDTVEKCSTVFWTNNSSTVIHTFAYNWLMLEYTF